MPTSTDLDTFFSLQGIWGKVRSDILSHLIVGAAVVFLFDITFPTLIPSDITMELIFTNPTFIALKESGFIVYFLPVLFALLFAYGLVIHSLGRLLINIQTVLFPPTFDTRGLVYSLPDSTIETIIRSMGTAHIRHNQIAARATELLARYQNLNKRDFDSFATSIKELGQNSLIYHGNLSVFFVVWITLPFVLSDENLWWQKNEDQHLPVVLFLFVCCLWSRWRAMIWYRQLLPQAYTFVAQMILQDDQMKTVLEQTEGSLEEIRDKIRQMRDEDQTPVHPPSLFLYCRAKLSNLRFLRRKRRSKLGWPFPKLYRKGEALNRTARDNRSQQYDNDWLRAYYAYRYYLLHNWLRRLPKLIWAICMMIIKGSIRVG